jgi:hypothetical protein
MVLAPIVALGTPLRGFLFLGLPSATVAPAGPFAAFQLTPGRR